MLVTPQQQNAFFMLLSLLVLSLGANVISVVTVFGRGNRTFAFIMSISATALGLFMYFQLDQTGVYPTAMGGLAFLIACWPPRKRERYDEDAELDRQGYL